MTINTHVAAGGFQFLVETFEQLMLYFDFASADTADDMVMIVFRNLIGHMATPRMGWAHKSVFREKI
jgi:hypothetical protein